MALHGVKNSGFRLDLTRSSYPAHGASVTLSPGTGAPVRRGFSNLLRRIVLRNNEMM